MWRWKKEKNWLDERIRRKTKINEEYVDFETLSTYINKCHDMKFYYDCLKTIINNNFNVIKEMDVYNNNPS